MRKFLRLSLASLLTLTCGFASADEVTFDWSNVKTTTVANKENIYTKEPITLTFSKGDNTSDNWPSENKEGSIRMYVATHLKIAASNGYLISKVDFTATGSNYGANKLTYEGKAISNSWTLSSPSQEVLLKATANARFKKIVVTYTAATADYVAPPTINGQTAFEGSTEVTITGAEGTTIYYTTDGSDPTTSSTSGASPVTFTLDKSATVKAIATLNENESDVASKEFTKVTFTDMTIADLYELEAPQEYINLKINNGKVVYVDGNDVYVRDGEYAILFYRTSLPFSKNAIVSGTVKADYDIYKGLPEIADNAFTNTSALTITESDEDALPLNATIKDIVTDEKYMCDLVKIENVKIISEVSGEKTNYYATDGTNQIQLYGADEVVKDYANEETEYNITAVVKMYNKAQLLPISVEVPTGITGVTVDEAFDENAPMYNLSGQRVDKNAKGIVIQNGKKFIRR